MSIYLLPRDLIDILSSGYATRTAATFANLTPDDRNLVTSEVNRKLRKVVCVEGHQVFMKDEHYKLANEVVNLVRHQRWPIYQALDAAYMQMYGNSISDPEDETQLTPDTVSERFRAGYQLPNHSLFNVMFLEYNYSRLTMNRLWALIVAIRIGDIELPSISELM